MTIATLLPLTIYSAIFLTGRKHKIETQLKPDFRFISKWFIGNVVARAGHKRYMHPLQSLFLFSFLNYWRINICYIVFECMREK